MLFRHKIFGFLFISWQLAGMPVTHGQSLQKHPALYFISDCQEPLPAEKIIRKAHNNIEGREALFREIENKNEGFVFLLGDLVGNGSKNNEWEGVDSFLKTLRRSSTKVYAIPGNHEYLFRANRGISNFQNRFPNLPLTGYCVRTDSMAIVLLNSNFRHLTGKEISSQQQWYMAEMDSLEADASVKAIIVCAHHSPFSNSKVVGSSGIVQKEFMPMFESSTKTKLFLTGHSHNLELFEVAGGKHCLVIGGGGGIDQPLFTGEKEKYKDMISQDEKPRFFYLVLQRKNNLLQVAVRGFSMELTPFSEIRLSL